MLVDADAQGSMTASLGFQQPDELDYTLANVLMDIIYDEDVCYPKGILHNAEGVDLMPANIDLAGMEVSMVGVMSRELILKQYIEQVKEYYDYIVIDCTPSLGMLTINALACADSVVIPVQCAYLPIKGLEQLIKTIGRVQKQLNSKLVIEGILLTMVDKRTTYGKEIAMLLRETYGDKIYIFPEEIPFSVRAAETSAEGMSIFKYDPKGKVAAAYEKLTEEVLSNETK